MRRQYHYSDSPDAFSLRAQYQLGSFAAPPPKRHHRSSRKHHSHHHHHREPVPSYYAYAEPDTTPHLSRLPPELKLLIHERLDPVTSTCLGLSSKEFYPTHRSLHKKVGLYDRHDRLPLCMYLKEWAPESYGLDWRNEKFVPVDGYGFSGGGSGGGIDRRERKRREREREYLGGRLRRSRKYSRLDVASLKWWR